MVTWTAEGVNDHRIGYRPATTPGNTTPHNTQIAGWMNDFRALVALYEKDRWQGLNDGTESRSFVPQRMRLVKHFFDLYDSACRANDEAATAIMASRLERLAFDRRSRWGGLF